jgi:uncharacterized protein YraI
MRMKVLALAAGGLIASLAAVQAATVATDLNLRAGPGTDYPVIDAMPAGAHVNVRSCTGSWCRVSFRGQTGWASANYLGGGERSTTVYRSRTYVAPSARYVAPGYAYGPAYDYPSYFDDGPYAYAPGFSIGIGFGGYGGHHWRGGHGHWR